jgi:hypothetical protein
MPKHKGPTLKEDRELEPYDYITFMEKFTQEKENANRAANGTGQTHQMDYQNAVSSAAPNGAAANGNGVHAGVDKVGPVTNGNGIQV